MSLLSWNCWGLGNLSAILALKDLIRYYHPDIIFLCETLVLSHCTKDIRSQIGFDYCFSVDANGKSSDLTFFWRYPFKCHLLNYSYFISLEINLPGSYVWQLIGYYGFPEHERCPNSWNHFQSITHSSLDPWYIFGDFNDLLSNDDKVGNLAHPN